MSFGRARSRLAGSKRRRENPKVAETVDRRAGETMSTMRHLAINSSQFGDDRPLSAIQVGGGADSICCLMYSSYSLSSAASDKDSPQ